MKLGTATRNGGREQGRGTESLQACRSNMKPVWRQQNSSLKHALFLSFLVLRGNIFFLEQIKEEK